MRFLLRMFLRLWLVILLALGVITAQRLLPPPADLQHVGFDRCGGKPCAVRSAGVIEFNDTPVSLGWAVAWFGVPCRASSYSGNVILTFDVVEVYARSNGWVRNSITAGDTIWGMEIIRNSDRVCRPQPVSPKQPGWRGFDSTSSISAGAFVRR